MGSRFIAETAKKDILAEISALMPANPFATAGYFESRRRSGCEVLVAGLRGEAGSLECGCGAFLTKGRLNTTFEIPSLPPVGADSPFWAGLRNFCRHRGVTRLELGTFGSPAGVVIPPLGRHCARRSRTEYVLGLADDLVAKLSSSHKKNMKKAQKAGLEVLRTTAADAVQVHHELVRQSADRRRARGEDVAIGGSSLDYSGILLSGAGELFQARKGATVVSSVLVLRAPNGGYSHSTGTSPEGMSVGASQFLLHNVALRLRAEGARVFNLGGADEGSSLAEFKEGFGASRVPLQSARCHIGPLWKRWAGLAIAGSGAVWRSFLNLGARRTSLMIVYSKETSGVSTPEPANGLAFRAMTADDLRALSAGDAPFRAHQLERLERFGTSYAYAVIADGQLAHISWLLPHSAMAIDPPRVVRARAGVAEITACETLPEFRGRGIYGFAIRNLVSLAREQGVRRVFMKTAADNKASQAGIEKAGLVRSGSAVLILLPLLQREVVWRRFR